MTFDFCKGFPSHIINTNSIFYTLLQDNTLRVKAFIDKKIYDLKIIGDVSVGTNPKAYVKALCYPYDGSTKKVQIEAHDQVVNFEIEGVARDFENPGFNRILCADTSSFPDGQYNDITLYDKILYEFWHDEKYGVLSPKGGGRFGITSDFLKGDFEKHGILGEGRFNDSVSVGYDFIAYMEAIFAGKLRPKHPANPEVFSTQYIIKTIEYCPSACYEVLAHEATFFATIKAESQFQVKREIEMLSAKMDIISNKWGEAHQKIQQYPELRSKMGLGPTENGQNLDLESLKVNMSIEHKLDLLMTQNNHLAEKMELILTHKFDKLYDLLERNCNNKDVCTDDILKHLNTNDLCKERAERIRDKIEEIKRILRK